MPTKMVTGLDKTSDSYYWTIILTKHDAMLLNTSAWIDFKLGLKMIEKALNTLEKDDDKVGQ